jgi:alpha-L-rhamnosidase
MNSFNHYAYGAAVDWIYMVAGGITPEKAGFEKIRIAPIPTEKLEWLSVQLETRRGRVEMKWYHEGKKIRYDIRTPVPATVVIAGKTYQVERGEYRFCEEK